MSARHGADLIQAIGEGAREDRRVCCVITMVGLAAGRREAQRIERRLT